MSAHPTQIQAAAQLQANTLFASLELSKARWLVTASAPGSDKLSRHPKYRAATAKRSSSCFGAFKPRLLGARRQ